MNTTIITARAHRRHVRRRVALATRYATLADMPRMLHVDAPAGDAAAEEVHDQESDLYRAAAEEALRGLSAEDVEWARGEHPRSPAVQAAATWAARQ